MVTGSAEPPDIIEALEWNRRAINAAGADVTHGAAQMVPRTVTLSCMNAVLAKLVQ